MKPEYSYNPKEISIAYALSHYSFYYFEYTNKQGQQVYVSMESHAITYWGQNHLCFKLDALNNLLVNGVSKIDGYDLLFNLNRLLHHFESEIPISYDLTGSRTPPASNSSEIHNVTYQQPTYSGLLYDAWPPKDLSTFAQDISVQVIC